MKWFVNNEKLVYLLFYVFSFYPFLNQHPSLIIYLNSIFVFLGFILIFWGKKLNRVIHFLLLLLSFILVAKEYASFRSLEAGVTGLTVLAILKLLELNSKRDVFYFLVIVELSLIGHLLNLESLIYLLFVLVHTAFLFFFLYLKKRGNKYGPILSRLQDFGKLMFYCIPIAAILFLAFPRVNVGNLFSNPVNPLNQIGFTERLRPGDFAELVGRKEIFFRASFDHKVPMVSELYWKGAVLERTDGFNWSKLSAKEENAYFAEKIGNTLSVHVSYASLFTKVLFTLGIPKKISLETNGRVISYGADTFGLLPFSNVAPRYRLVYTEEKSSYDERHNRRYLQVPERVISERFKRLIDSYKSLSLTNLQVAQKVEELFLTERFSYSLSPKKIESGTALEKLDKFLFDTKEGYCEHFAAAMAIILRYIGVPSRVVTGFQGGMKNPIGEHFSVGAQDAHAWVEVFDGKSSWIKFDPTEVIAPDRIKLGANDYFEFISLPEGVKFEDYLNERNRGFWSRFKFAVDTMYYQLNRRFLGYDLDSQLNFLAKLGLTKEKSFIAMLLVVFLALIALFALVNKVNLGQVKKEDLLFDIFLKKLRKYQIFYQKNQDFTQLKTKLESNKIDKELAIKIVDCYQLLRYAPNNEELKYLLLNQMKSLIKKFR